ncbi:CCR4-NOT transcription complex subunit 7 [Hondaea fermentalgiana]|uniref:poly(A)-specific ribonuclease n=1 Tax=Hondaea fermentalgiana TaxID=2315210 RepID=A0A2R5GTG9_9STRA|nr:CCR4-NOT transcription complex subunit 7 [Hondaea fermentalgiana]|eukprot:GBG34167.1 CCR4-NOT transcription complex subunit 7 [Hondaea fermentalgiana]
MHRNQPNGLGSSGDYGSGGGGGYMGGLGGLGMDAGNSYSGAGDSGGYQNAGGGGGGYLGGHNGYQQMPGLGGSDSRYGPDGGLGSGGGGMLNQMHLQRASSYGAQQHYQQQQPQQQHMQHQAQQQSMLQQHQSAPQSRHHFQPQTPPLAPQQQQQMQHMQPQHQHQHQAPHLQGPTASPALPPPPGARPGLEDPEMSKLIKTRGHVYDYKGRKVEIRDVWCDNLDQEMAVIREVVQKYNYVAMDTEFPGVVARPIGSFESSEDFQYQTLRCNVDLLRLIQLGIALADDDGNFAEGCPCWQFHFKFSLTDDMYAQDSIDLLVRSGIDFDLHEKMGIDVQDFGEQLMSSGLVLLKEVKWITFHGGFDVAYLLKLLTCAPLPDREAEFFNLLHLYFPSMFDIKAIMTKLESAPFKSGLSKLAEDLGAERVGPMHQAGSDSLLTASVFFALRRRFFNDAFDEGDYVGIMHGLGKGRV